MNKIQASLIIATTSSFAISGYLFGELANRDQSCAVEREWVAHLKNQERRHVEEWGEVDYRTLGLHLLYWNFYPEHKFKDFTHLGRDYNPFEGDE